VIGYPPNLTEALTLPTTSRSANGLQGMSAALGKNGSTTPLEALTQGGFTIFVPVDDAWTNDAKLQLNDSSTAKTLLQNHVSNLSIGLQVQFDPGEITVLDKFQHVLWLLHRFGIVLPIHGFGSESSFDL